MFVFLKSPTSRNHRIFSQWIQGRNPLTPRDQRFMEFRDDFVTLAEDQESSHFDGIVEDVLDFCLPRKVMQVSSLFLAILPTELPLAGSYRGSGNIHVT